MTDPRADAVDRLEKAANVIIQQLAAASDPPRPDEVRDMVRLSEQLARILEAQRLLQERA